MDFSTIGTVIGSALMIGSPAYMLWWRWQVARHWTIVDGVVVRMQLIDGPAGKEDGIFRAIIRARRPDGETVQFESHFGSNPSPWKEGDLVAVRMRGDVVQHDAPWFALWCYGAVMIVGLVVLSLAQRWATWGDDAVIVPSQSPSRPQIV